MADGNGASLYSSFYLELSPGDAYAVRNANQNQRSAIQVQRPLVIFVYFCHHPTNESLHFRRLLSLGFLGLYSFKQRMVEALA